MLSEELRDLLFTDATMIVASVFTCLLCMICARCCCKIMVRKVKNRDLNIVTDEIEQIQAEIIDLERKVAAGEVVEPIPIV